METIQKIQGMNEAIKTLTEARGELANGSVTIWRIVDHAIRRLEQQIDELLAPEAQ